MSHHVQGFIARVETLSAAMRRFKQAYVAMLPQGFGFLPNTHELRDEVGAERVVPDETFMLLTLPLEALGVELSARSPVAYVETDYFGGHGKQVSVVWDQGQVAMAPTSYSSGEDILTHGAINRALRILCVRRTEFDEFDSLHLGWYRDNESFSGPDSARRLHGG